MKKDVQYSGNRSLFAKLIGGNGRFEKQLFKILLSYDSNSVSIESNEKLCQLCFDMLSQLGAVNQIYFLIEDKTWPKVVSSYLVQPVKEQSSIVEDLIRLNGEHNQYHPRLLTEQLNKKQNNWFYITLDKNANEHFIFHGKLAVTPQTKIALRLIGLKLLSLKTEVKYQYLANKQLGIQARLSKYEDTIKTNKLLFDLTALSAQKKEIGALYPSFLQSIGQLVDCQTSYLAQLTADGKLEFRFLEATNPLSEKLHALLISQVLDSGKAEVFTPLRFAELLTNKGLLKEKDKLKESWLGAPVFIKGEAQGVLAITTNHGEPALTNGIKRLVCFIANLISCVLERELAVSELQLRSQELEKVVQLRTQTLSESNRKLEQEIREKQQQEEQLKYGALHDPLTQLPNRSLFMEKLNQALLHVQRHETDTFAVIFVDLDKFKTINDNYGHHIGDQLLIETGARLDQSIRLNDLLARIGGDEFVILLDKISERVDIDEVSNRILASFSNPFEISGYHLPVTCSIGATKVTGDYTSCEQIMEEADQAMYKSKRLGYNNYQIFEPGSYNPQSDEFKKELKAALSHGDIVPHYQPMIRLKDNALMGFEVVARWNFAKQKLRRALDFIPLAEKTGLIIDLDRDILAKACRQLQIWQKVNHANDAIRVAVNLSSKHLINEESLQKLIETIDESKLPPRNLVLEFSERDFVRQHQMAFESLKTLREMGVLVGLDDFGTGFSSLNALFDYPIDFIKVDRSFTSKMLNSSRNLSLMRAIRDISNDLGFQVIIEGIETAQQHKKLVEIGCEYGQGYYISKPMRQEAIKSIFHP